ncbi:MAG TPA: UDP-2,3-diacylglucosamine diphosphatase [Bacteroidia bacterium]|nr:UDP-2,3-diacylglucosamine diphosphatase [Bacteroidia bacterium]
MSYKRKVQLAVISDIHLGTFGCQAKELLQYLNTIEPEVLILNGDIVDIWQFSKHYWPTSHMMVINYIIDLISKGTKIYYITGNHDEMLRKFVGFKISNFSIVNKVVLTIDKKKVWIFHGDVFDVTMKHSKWLAKLGAIGYDTLILINHAFNWYRQKIGKEKYSFSQKVKDSVKSAVKFINDFETTAAEIAIDKGYQFVICGHIHQPVIKNVETEKGNITYLNSGDWIENLTSLEYDEGAWSIYKYQEDHLAKSIQLDFNTSVSKNNAELFQELIGEFKLTGS